MSQTDTVQHELIYDGKANELYKIYLLSLFFSILTLGIYHFWGKTRKRRYITSSFQLDKDRFEYTGYGGELLLGLILGLLLLTILSTPLMWSCYTISQHTNKTEQSIQSPSNDKSEPSYHIEQYDHFKKNKLIIDYKSPTSFWIVYKTNGFLLDYKDNRLEIRTFFQNEYGGYELPLIFNPKENTTLLLAIALIPVYLVFYFIFLPFLIVYGSLRYRVSRLRWRGIRGHLEGSAVLYGLIGIFQTFMKIITLGFWIPISDAVMIKYKVKKLYFGSERATFIPSTKNLIIANLASIGASLYLITLMVACGYWLLPAIANYSPTENWIIKEFVIKILEKGYLICFMILAWGCYAPRYWYRAALLRERYNKLRFGKVGFECNATGLGYLKLFVINDLIFIFTLGFGLPFIWQRRMEFFCRHIKVTGDWKTISIEQAPGTKSKFGGGFASVMNLEIGLI